MADKAHRQSYLIALPLPPRYIIGMKPPNPPKAAAGTKYAPPPPLPLKPRPLPRPLIPPLSVELTPGRLVLFSVTCNNNNYPYVTLHLK